MKITTHNFRKPIKVIQVFRNINHYGKEDKSFSNRKEKLSWKPIESKIGYVQNNQLFLPQRIISDPKFQHCNLILMVDDNLPTKPTGIVCEEKSYCFQFTGTTNFDIFQLKLTDQIELHLIYSIYNIGAPTRPNFKVATIKEKQPVAIKINGKIDSRRQRYFQEFEYVFDYLGHFHQCLLTVDPYCTKICPKPDKLVDLNQTLW